VTASGWATLQHPRVAALAGLAGGLLAAGALGARATGVVLVLAVVAAAVGGLGARPALGLVVAVALVGGVLAGHARLAALDRTALAPLVGRTVAVRADVVAAPKERSWGGWSVPVRIVAGPGQGERVVVRWKGARPPGVGFEVAVRGRLDELAPWESYEGLRGAHAALEATALEATGRRRGGLAGLIDTVRRRAEAALEHGLSPPQAGLARGMVLGQDDALDGRTRDAFRASGLGHLLAASGANVALLVVLAGGAVALLGGGLRLRLGVALALVALYVPLAGGGPSILRAGIMGGAMLVAGLAGRPTARVYALVLAAAGTLALNPRACADVGWQLSFAAVVAIALLAPPTRDALVRRRVPRGVAEAVAITGAATLGTAPISALQFGQLSLVSLPANVVVAPAVAPVVWLGTLAGAIGQLGAVTGPVVALLDALLALPLGFVAMVADVAARAPHATIALTVGVPVVLAAYAVLIAAAVPSVRGAVARASRRGRRALRTDRRVAFGVAGVVLIAVVAAAVLRPRTPLPPRAPTISFLDVGQGDAILLQEGTVAALVDTGPPDGPVLARLRESGVTRLDLLVLTHGEADHDGAATRILAAMHVGAVLDGAATAPADPRSEARVEAAIAGSGARRIVPHAGQRLRLGGFVLDVLWPPPDPPPPGIDPNLRAVVLHVRRGTVDALLTADAESPVTGPLDLPPVDILKVAHHGSDDPGLPALLERLRPKLAAIEVGAHNDYGHPTASTLSALAAAHVPVVRTDQDGTVRVTLDDRALHVEESR
jgi:competence protein ComEC